MRSYVLSIGPPASDLALTAATGGYAYTGTAASLTAPTSATLLFSDDFEDQTFDAWTESGDQTIVTSPTPQSGTYCVKYDETQNTSSNRLRKLITGTKRAYASWYAYFPSTFQWDSCAGGHSNRFYTSSGSIQMDTSYTGTSLKAKVIYTLDGNGEEVDGHNEAIPNDEWVFMEYDMQWNTLGQSDGHLRGYVNGVLSISMENRGWVTEAEVYTNEFAIYTNDDRYYECDPGLTQAQMVQYCDDVKLYDKDPVRG